MLVVINEAYNEFDKGLLMRSLTHFWLLGGRDLDRLGRLQAEAHRRGALQDLRPAAGHGPAEGAAVGEGHQLQQVVRGRALQELVAREEHASAAF